MGDKLDNLRRECDHAEKKGGWCGRCEGRAPKKAGKTYVQPSFGNSIESFNPEIASEAGIADADHSGTLPPADPVPCVEHGVDCFMHGETHVPSLAGERNQKALPSLTIAENRMLKYALDAENEAEVEQWAKDWLSAKILEGAVPEDRDLAIEPLREKLAELVPLPGGEEAATELLSFDGTNNPEFSEFADGMEAMCQRVLDSVFGPGPSYSAHAGLRTAEWMEAHADAGDGAGKAPKRKKEPMGSQYPPACSGEEQRAMLQALIPLLSEDEVGQVLDLYNANLQSTGNELAPIAKSLIEAHGLTKLIPKGADERWFEYTGIGIVRDWESKNKGAKDMADKKRIDSTPSAPSDTDIWDVKTIEPRDRQRKLDQLLDQYSAEEDPERKTQLEEQMRSLRASLRVEAGKECTLYEETRVWGRVPKDQNDKVPSIVLPIGTKLRIGRSFRLDHGGSPELVEVSWDDTSGGGSTAQRGAGVVRSSDLNGKWESTDQGSDDDALLEDLNTPIPQGSPTFKSKPSNMHPEDVKSIPPQEIQRRKDTLMDEFNAGALEADEYEARMEQLRSMGSSLKINAGELCEVCDAPATQKSSTGFRCKDHPEQDAPTDETFVAVDGPNNDDLFEAAKLAGFEAEQGGGGNIVLFLDTGDGGHLTFGFANGPLGYMLEETEGDPTDAGEMPEGPATAEQMAQFIKQVADKYKAYQSTFSANEGTEGLGGTEASRTAKWIPPFPKPGEHKGYFGWVEDSDLDELWFLVNNDRKLHDMAWHDFGATAEEYFERAHNESVLNIPEILRFLQLYYYDILAAYPNLPQAENGDPIGESSPMGQETVKDEYGNEQKAPLGPEHVKSENPDALLDAFNAGDIDEETLKRKMRNLHGAARGFSKEASDLQDALMRALLRIKETRPDIAAVIEEELNKELGFQEQPQVQPMSTSGWLRTAEPEKPCDSVHLPGKTCPKCHQFIEEARSDGEKDGLYSEWDGGTDDVVADYEDTLQSGGDKEPWQLAGTEFAESYKASPNPLEWYKNIEIQGLEGKLKQVLQEKAYEDQDSHQWAWESFCEDLTNLMDTVNPGTPKIWRVNMRNFGWMHEDNDGTVTANTGEELRQNILPNTDCHFKVYKEGRGIKINNSHHDAPMGGEVYYITPFDADAPNPEQTPRQLQLSVAPEMAEELGAHHDQMLERSRPKETGYQDPNAKITPEQLDAAPSTPFEVPTMQPRDRQQKLDSLLDQYNEEQDPERRQQLEEQMRSLRAQRGGWLKQANDLMCPRCGGQAEYYEQTFRKCTQCNWDQQDSERMGAKDGWLKHSAITCGNCSGTGKVDDSKHPGLGRELDCESCMRTEAIGSEGDPEVPDHRSPEEQFQAVQRSAENIYDHWVNSPEGIEDWDGARDAFPGYNSSQADEAAEFLLTCLENYCDATNLLTTEEFEALREDLYESIYAGLT